ncbi:MAG: cyclic nucleotide-binding domain-containing protein [Pseudomonadota bacterium]
MSDTGSLGRQPPSFSCVGCGLREVGICGELTDGEVSVISRTMAKLPVEAGGTVLREDEPSPYLFMISLGGFRLVKNLEDGRRQIVGFLFPGDFMGMSFETPAEFSAEALEPSRVCRFSHSMLNELSFKHPGIKDRLIAKGHHDLQRAQAHVLLLSQPSAEERVSMFLSTLSDQYKSEAFCLPMPRQDIADYLALRLETLSRCLAKLRKSGAVAVDGRHVVLKQAL